MPGKPGRLEVRIEPGQGVDAAELEQMALQLRDELLDLDVESVEIARVGAAPEGTRGIEALEAGKYVIELADAAGGAFAVVMAVRAWLSRHRRTGLRLSLNGHELRVDGVSSAEEDRMVAEWLAVAKRENVS